MRGRLLIAGAALGLALWVAAPSGQEPGAPTSAVDGEILVRFRPQATNARRDAALRTVGGQRIRRFGAVNVDHVRLPRGRSVDQAVAAIRANVDVETAQPNYIRHTTSDPPPNDFFWLNDIAYDFYGMKKIQADQVWNSYTTGSSAIIVADIDTGVKYNHADLAANMWTNPDEIPNNNIDDDANGYIDDVYGIDTYNHDSNPMDDNGHGTHTSGTFGAVGNNGTGVVGVNWNVTILACKFLNSAGSGTDAGAIECFNYITALKNRGENIRVSSNSWGSYRNLAGPFPQLLKDAIDTAGNAGILNVFAAGNGGADNIGDNTDFMTHDPSSFDSPSIISVASSDQGDVRAGSSNFGAVSVDLAAPGVHILSTWINAAGCVPCYAWSSGTSMAAPHVAGAAALLLAQSPDIPVAGLKALILDNVTPLPAWTEPMVTGGRLNVFNNANALAANTPPSVNITSPVAGASFTEPAALNVSADASDAGGSVTRVDFYANGVPIGSDSSSPFSIVSANVPAGTYALTAKATDNLGAESTSSPVLVTVLPAVTTSISLSDSTVAFAQRLVGTVSAPAPPITITNTGAAILVFASFNGAPPASAFTLGGGDFQAQTDCPIGPGAALAPAASCTFTFQFSPVAAGSRDTALSIVTNATTSPSVIALTGAAFVVDEPTVSATIVSGGSRLQSLQNADGGWYYRAADTSCGYGPGVSCTNTLGVTALGLLSAYDRSGDPLTLAAAVATGDRLVADYLAAPTQEPHSQDLEFLVALTQATSDPQYEATATLWFQAILALHPDAAEYVDQNFADRGTLFTAAVWDVASLIRTAKAANEADYASAAANRVRERETEWMDLDPTHRWDHCGNSGGCGPADNPWSYDHTLIGMGSMLWAIHDLPGFDADIDAYRSFLLSQQDAEGSWDAGDLQVTAYVILGLSAVGGTGTSAAIQSAAAYFIANQLPASGWPSWIVGEAAGAENTEADAEIIRAIATLFSTPMGLGVEVTPAQLSTVTFSAVTAAGATTVVARQSPGGTRVPPGYSLIAGLSYEARTSAVTAGASTVCLAVPWAVASGDFGNLRVLHEEQGEFVDRTILDGPMAPNAASKRICATASALDMWAVASLDADTTAPEITMTLSPSILWPANNRLVTVTATIAVSDDRDAAPAVTLLSITSSDDRRGRRWLKDVQGAALGTDDRTFRLRAERSPRGSERTYTIVYRATDSAGNATEVAAEVVVPGRGRSGRGQGRD